MRLRIDGHPSEVELAKSALSALLNIRHTSDPVPSRAGGGRVRIVVVATVAPAERAEQLRDGGVR